MTCRRRLPNATPIRTAPEAIAVSGDSSCFSPAPAVIAAAETSAQTAVKRRGWARATNPETTSATSATTSP